MQFWYYYKGRPLFPFYFIQYQNASGEKKLQIHQFLIQIGGVLIISVYAFVVTFLILKVVNSFVPVRVTEDEEARGLDNSIHHEEAYRYLIC